MNISLWTKTCHNYIIQIEILVCMILVIPKVQFNQMNTHYITVKAILLNLIDLKCLH